MKKHDKIHNMKYAPRLRIFGLKMNDYNIFGSIVFEELDCMTANCPKMGLTGKMKEKAVSLAGRILNFTGYYEDDLLVESIYLEPNCSTLKCKSIEGNEQLIFFSSGQYGPTKRISIIEKDNITTIEFALEGKHQKKGKINITKRESSPEEPLSLLFNKAYNIHIEEETNSSIGEEENSIQNKINILEGIRKILLESKTKLNQAAAKIKRL